VISEGARTDGTHLDFPEPEKAYNNETADVKKSPAHVALPIKKMDKQVLSRRVPSPFA